MVAARDEFLGAGHFEPIADATAAAALEAIGERAGTPGFAVDLGAGTGYQLARLLDSLPALAGPGARRLRARPAPRRPRPSSDRPWPATSGASCRCGTEPPTSP